MIRTACALDCPDACSILIDLDNLPKLEADTNNGTLCSLLNKELLDTPRIEQPSIDGEAVSMDEALDAVAQALKQKSLLWRGSGNFGVMQEVTNLLFEQIGGTLTKGSLCDGAGDAGIREGRGVNRTLPLEQIERADVVILWGKNPSTTSTHLLPYIEGKELVVIDPVATPLAKKADLHIQITPRSDAYLALMLARFVIMQDCEDTEWLEEFAPEFSEFYDFTREFRVKAILQHIGIELGDMGRLIDYMQRGKVVFLVGNGVQKYSTGHYTLWAIDSLVATLGLFGKEGCGVGYLGNSKLGFVNPFEAQCPQVSKVNTPFAQFDTLLIQGGNPVESMPNSSRVVEEMQEVKNLIYFGLYANESSRLANIIIPAKNFFEKDDIRLSYGHHEVKVMPQVIKSDIGISEYDFCVALIKRLGLEELGTQEAYLQQWLEQCDRVGDEYRSPAYQERPYSEGFGANDDDDFLFIDDFDDTFETPRDLQKYRKLSTTKVRKMDYWLLTPKAKNSLNTQFRRDDRVHIHPSLGYKDGESVMVSSSHGSHKFIIKNSKNLRVDCLLITANTLGVNYLTPSIISEEGEGACYQEVKVTLE